MIVPFTVAPTIVTAPLNVPVVAVSAATSNGDAETVIADDLSAAVAVVKPNINLSAFSCHRIAALFPALPLSIMIPALLVFAVAPVFNSIILSSIVVLVVFTVVDEPPTVKFPGMLTVKASISTVFEPDPELNPSPALIV